MKLHRLVLIALPILMISASLCSARSILERKMFYLNTSDKSGEAKYWVVYLGQFATNLTRNIPGEGEIKISANMNLQLISSGYIEGNGYGSKGKIDCLPVMTIKTAQSEHKIEMDSIDYFYQMGRKVKMLNGEDGEFLIDIEGQKVSTKQFTLKEYKLVNYYGEQILKTAAEQDVPLSGISFSKDGPSKILKTTAAPAPSGN